LASSGGFTFDDCDEDKRTSHREMAEFVEQSHRMDGQLGHPMVPHTQTHDPDDTSGHEDLSAVESARIPHSSTAMVCQAAAIIVPTLFARGAEVVGCAGGLVAWDSRRWFR
jgi:hypothetical protein